MSGIWIEMQSGDMIFKTTWIAKCDDKIIYVGGVGEEQQVEYKTMEKCDRTWEMLENAIASGVRLFRFPTDAEVEKGEDE